MTLQVCRVIRDFPFLKRIRELDTSNVRKKRVEYTEYGLAPGIYALMKEQVRLGAFMKVVSAKRREASVDEVEGNIEVHRVGKPYEMMAVAKIVGISRTLGIDVIHAHATSSILYALLRPVLKRKPYVVHVHGTTAGVRSAMTPIYHSRQVQRIGDSRRVVWNWLSLERQRVVWSRADLLIAVSSNIESELRNLYGFPAEKIRIVHNGVDVSYFRPADGVTKENARKRLGIQGGPLFLYVGHLSPRKGLEDLLRSIPIVTKNYPDAVFAIVGGSPKFVGKKDYQSQWTQLAAHLGIQKNTLFTGEVRHRDILSYYQAADFFVFPTLYEGLAKALLEAMACGLPIVTTNVGGNSDAIADQVNGFLVEPSDPRKLAGALIRVATDEALASDLGRKARATVEQRFTWQNAASEIACIYEELLPR